MRKAIIGLMMVFAVTTLATSANASNVGFSFGINIGVPATVYAPPPVVYAPPPVVIDSPPEFVAQPGLGFYAAMGTPYDLFYAANGYYLYRGNMWYAAPNYNGPWVQVGYRTIPWSLRRYPMARIRYMRDEGCRHYYDDDNYGYRHFRPERNDWRDRHARWDGEDPREVGHSHHYRHWENDDED
jgi:hypothetical protein